MLTRSDQIVVGIDGSSRSEDALAFAMQITDGTGAAVTLVAAFAHPDWPAGSGNADADAMLARAADHVDRPVDVRAVEAASPARALHEIAEQERAALLVIGSSHRGRIGRVLPGSTGDHVLHETPCAVAIVPDGYRLREPSIARVGIGYDGSGPARSALAAAETLTERLGGQLQVINGFDPTMLGLPSPSVAELELGASADRSEVTFVRGDAANGLVEASEHLDLLVLGSRGHGPLPSVLLGSVSRRVVRRAACPVMVIPAVHE
jgi:nucleotide-binding universal stress UspA family protein